jgi:hypothetical protein
VLRSTSEGCVCFDEYRCLLSLLHCRPVTRRLLFVIVSHSQTRNWRGSGQHSTTDDTTYSRVLVCPAPPAMDWIPVHRLHIFVALVHRVMMAVVPKMITNLDTLSYFGILLSISSRMRTVCLCSGNYVGRMCVCVCVHVSDLLCQRANSSSSLRTMSTSK